MHFPDLRKLISADGHASSLHGGRLTHLQRSILYFFGRKHIFRVILFCISEKSRIFAADIRTNTIHTSKAMGLPKLVTLIATLLCGATLFCSCMYNADTREYKIGVSQCSGGDWREKMNDEMRREAIFHPGITFDFCNAADDPSKQMRDVDSLIEAKVDLLVVAPIDSAHGRALVNKAMGHGIPVIVADRRLQGSDYTAYVGGDNYDVGRNAAEYLVSRLPKGGEVFEIRGHDGSSPVEMRHQGFVDVLKKHPEFKLVESVDGWWLRDSAKVRMEDAIHTHPELRAVYCHNDYMAMGAIEMFRWVRQCQRDYGDEVPSWNPLFIGVDAVYGANHGLEWIARGDLDASVLYPTGGDVIVQTAVKILQGEPFDRDNILKVSVVDRQGAALLNDMDLAVINEVGKVHWLQNRQISLLRRIDVEQWLLIVSGLFLVFITIAMFQMRRHHLERRRTALHLVRANRRLRDAAHLQLKELKVQQVTSNMAQPTSAPKTEAAAKPHETVEPKPVSAAEAAHIETCDIDPFMEQVYRLIDDNYADADFGVEMLSVLLNLSRSQLYRRIKNLTGMTPFDMIRDKRFSVAEELLKQGMTLDQTAQSVGFASTSYFVRCYEEYKQMAE